MKTVTCSHEGCERTFTKKNAQLADAALMMHVGRVHTKTVINTPRVGRPRKVYQEHNGNDNGAVIVADHNHNHGQLVGQRRSKLTLEERGKIVEYIRTHHQEFNTKSACFREAMKTLGLEDRIKVNSVAVDRHFKFAFAPADKPKAAKRRYFRGDVVDKVLAHYAPPGTEKCDCPNCHYDFTLLKPSRIAARYCPGCGTSIQTLINQLLNLLNP